MGRGFSVGRVDRETRISWTEQMTFELEVMLKNQSQTIRITHVNAFMLSRLQGLKRDKCGHFVIGGMKLFRYRSY